MNSSREYETTDVVICGCGPTGAVLTATLGQMAVPNIVLEKELDIVTDPRGIALDEDGIRVLQGLGLYDKIFTEMGSCIGYTYFISGKHGLHTKPFMQMNLNTTEGGTGHVAAMCHKQPEIEKNLRLVAARHPCSQLRSGSTVTAIEEDDKWVYVTYRDRGGKDHTVRAKFLVGADGKTGFTRKRYLESKGVSMETQSGREYAETWVALNLKMDLPTKETHPNFPLWKLGYSPEDVYNAFFPKNFRFIGNPDRPAVCGRFGLPSERLWRFEFVVQEDEDGQQMASYEKTAKIIFPYLTHPGQRYGLKGAVRFPEDCINVLRSSAFFFSARSCNKWSVGRVILCGDAAHVFPPFGGQGIASGFRDASALAWRLAVACRPDYDRNHEALLTGWYLERKQQLERSLEATVINGNFCTERNLVKIFFRDWTIWFMRLIPSWAHWLELGPRANGMIKYDWTEGMAFLPDLHGGHSMPQVYCCKVSQSFKEERPQVRFTDDVIFAPGKKGILQLVVVVDSLEEVEEAKTALGDVDRLSKGEVIADEATFLIHDPSFTLDVSKAAVAATSVFRIATGSEFAADEILCRNRPEPQGYDMYQIKKDLKNQRFVLVRPDRFVFAACPTKEELNEACKRIDMTVKGCK